MFKFVVADKESRSRIDLPACGVDVYSKDSSTDILCMALKFDDGEEIMWVYGKPLPKRLLEYISKKYLFIAHNLAFEFNMWNNCGVKKYGWPKLDLNQCDDTMARANAMGFPGSLDMAAKACGITLEKDLKGRRVMMMLSQPNREGEFWTPETQPEKFKELYEYCMTDTRVEFELHKKLAPLSALERNIWLLDQKINQRGVGIDLKLARQCDSMVKEEQERLQIELQMLTANQVPSYNSHAAFKKWVIAQGVENVTSIDKESVTGLLARENIPGNVRRAFQIRQEAAKSSTAKLTAMLLGTTGGRARYTFEHYGAKQTGRWAGRRLQLHNMPRSKLKFSDIEDALTRLERRDEIEMLYGNPMQVASDCLRSFLVPAKGAKFLTADFSNIEGRCLAWLANEEWKIKAFEDFDAGLGSDLYILEYARAFRIPVRSVTSDMRQIGKVITLAMGYAGGVGAFQNMAKAYGVKVPDSKANELKELWRNANPKIVEYWADVEHAALSAIKNKGNAFGVGHGAARVVFKTAGSFLCVKLPSSRTMYYPYPMVGKQIWAKIKSSPIAKNVQSKTFQGATEAEAKFKARLFCEKNNQILKEMSHSSDCIMYKSYDSVTKQWGYTATYGGSLVENLCQAVSRDVLADAMLRLEARGYPVVLHCHDEVVCEVKDDPAINLAAYEKVMSEVPNWAEGFPIASSGWQGYRYRKA